MSSFSRTPSRLGRLKAQVKTVLSRASSSGTKPSLIKRHTAPADIGLPRVSVPPRHARTHSERDPRDYRYAHSEGASAYLDPYSSVHLHPSVSGTVRPPRHRSEEYYSGVSPLTPDAYALLDDYFPPRHSAGTSRASSASRSGTGTASTPASTRTSPTSSRANSYAPALSAFARPSRPSSRTGTSPTSSRADSYAPVQPTTSTFARSTPSRRTRRDPAYPRPPNSYGSSAPRDKTELAAVLADPYYHHAGARPPSRPHGARAMPNAAVVPVYVNVYGTKGRRGWLGGARRK